MEFLVKMDSSVWIVILSALAAAASFAAFAIPMLQRKEQKERYKDVIEKKRRALRLPCLSHLVSRGSSSERVAVRANFGSSAICGCSRAASIRSARARSGAPAT